MYKTGDVFEEEVVFTGVQVQQFAEFTGDFNPIHVDEEFAKKTKYGRVIVHGLLAALAFSKILVTKFPGPGTIVIHKDITFIRPVFINETYKLIFKVAAIDFEKNRCIIKCFMKNREGKHCLRIINTLKNSVILNRKNFQ